jgi:predicted metal-dependent enzyme (double-stranded beta helix superfamily)
MTTIRAVVATLGVDRHTLGTIQTALVDLASRTELFSCAHFPPPSDPARDSNMYELCRGGSDTLTLYASVAPAGLETPPHYHGTWAAIAGVRGIEENQLYRRDASGSISPTSIELIRQGTSIGMLDDDVHSIRIIPTLEPFFSLHLYGLPFEITQREYCDMSTGKWCRYAARPNIRRFDLGAEHEAG